MLVQKRKKRIVLRRASARESMARSRAKKKKEDRAARRRIRELDLRRASARESMARSRAKKKKEDRATKRRIRELVHRRASARKRKAHWRAKQKSDATPTATATATEKTSTVDIENENENGNLDSMSNTSDDSSKNFAKIVNEINDDFIYSRKVGDQLMATFCRDGGGRRSMRFMRVNVTWNDIPLPLKSCCYDTNPILIPIAKKIFDDLFGSPIRTPCSEGNGIIITADSCYGNTPTINILRKSYLRQNYGLDYSEVRSINKDGIFRYSYGTGCGLNTLGIPRRQVPKYILSFINIYI